MDEALAHYDEAVRLGPQFPEPWNNRGLVLQALKRHEDAARSFEKAIALKPNYAEAFLNLGNSLKAGKQYERALVCFDKALALNPAHAEAHNNRGVVLQELNRIEEAISSYNLALEKKPQYVEAIFNRGNAYKALKRFEEAVLSYTRAITLKPDYAEAHCNLGNLYKELRKPTQALGSYERAIRSKPAYAAAYTNFSLLLTEMKLHDAALAAAEQALAIAPERAEAHFCCGMALEAQNKLPQALESFNQALALKPNYEFLIGHRLHKQMQLCDWHGLDEQLAMLQASIQGGEKSTSPFPILGLIDYLGLHKKVAAAYASHLYPESKNAVVFKPHGPSERLRIGYFSADYHNHATAYLMAELFEKHNRDRVELYGFSYGPHSEGEMRQRLMRGFDHWVDLTEQSDSEAAALSRSLGIDIAIDLKGYTTDTRTGLFAARCAPIQVNYLGYPGTMAAPYFNYIIADKVLIPPESQCHYTEQVVYMPHSYQVNDSKRTISNKLQKRGDWGLSDNAFVFCCFNNNFKIMPATFDGWMRILQAVPGSVLWLLEDNPTAAVNLRQEAQTRGVDPGRLVFAARTDLPEHLARQRLADLFLDTLPYNAHTTTSDALWAGLPVLTLRGQSFPARVAASLLQAVNLPELITDSQSAYEAKAIELARNPHQLVEIKARLAQQRTVSPLFNASLFAQHLELAYAEMARRHAAGEAPTPIDVSALTGRVDK